MNRNSLAVEVRELFSRGGTEMSRCKGQGQAEGVRDDEWMSSP